MQPQQQHLYLEVELMFCDLLDQGGPEKFQSFQSLRDLDTAKLEFKPVSARSFCLRQVHEGIFEYTPVVFQE